MKTIRCMRESKSFQCTIFATEMSSSNKRILPVRTDIIYLVGLQYSGIWLFHCQTKVNLLIFNCSNFLNSYGWQSCINSEFIPNLNIFAYVLARQHSISPHFLLGGTTLSLKFCKGWGRGGIRKKWLSGGLKRVPARDIFQGGLLYSLSKNDFVKQIMALRTQFQYQYKYYC